MMTQQEVIREVVEGINRMPVGRSILSNWCPPEGFLLKREKIEKVNVEWLIPKKKSTDILIFHLHGGSYVYGLLDAYRDVAVAYSKMSRGGEVISIDYRVAPTHTYPAALKDAVDAYCYLLESGYDANKIFVIGDSAGGNLALALTLYLRDNKIALPKGVILISPWVDMKGKMPSRKENKDRDLIVVEGRGYTLLNEVEKPSYVGKEKMENPYISPINAEYTGFPPLLIQNGSYEILVDEGREVYNRAQSAGVKVQYSIYEGMSHDFSLFLPMLRESKVAALEMRKFIEECMKQK